MAQEDSTIRRSRPRQVASEMVPGSETPPQGETVSDLSQAEVTMEGEKEMTVEGTVTINDGVVASIAAHAVEEVEGVYSVGTPSVTRSVAQAIGAARPATRGVSVQVGKTEAAFDLTIVVQYGYKIPDVVAKVKENVVTQVESLTGLKVRRVNITVSDIQAPIRRTEGTGIELR